MAEPGAGEWALSPHGSVITTLVREPGLFYADDEEETRRRRVREFLTAFAGVCFSGARRQTWIDGRINSRPGSSMDLGPEPGLWLSS